MNVSCLMASPLHFSETTERQHVSDITTVTSPGCLRLASRFFGAVIVFSVSNTDGNGMETVRHLTIVALPSTKSMLSSSSRSKLARSCLESKPCPACSALRFLYPEPNFRCKDTQRAYDPQMSIRVQCRIARLGKDIWDFFC